MSKNNKKNKNKQEAKQEAEARREAKIKMQPTCYIFNFKDVPIETYAKTLDLLFHDPDFVEMVQKRNNLVNTAVRINPLSAEMQNLVRTIQQRDRKLADMLFAILVQSNLRSEVTFDFLSFNHLLQYYVDYSKEGMQERVNKLSANLDKMTFLADMLESLLTDIKADMREVFGGGIEFNQFDAVAQVMQQLRGYFNSARSKDNSSPEAQLYFDYADSINEYLDKRLKTYSDKYRKLKPMIPSYTKEQMVEAINLFFGTKDKFDETYIGHTENGGCYIDAVRLASNLSPSETKLLDDVMKKAKCKVDATKDALNYSLQVSDAIMLCYKMSRKPKK